MQEIEKYIDLIEEWAKERGLDKKGTVEGQKIKTAEEIAELIKAISKDNVEEIKDSVGDIFVTIVVGSMLEKLELFNQIESSAREFSLYFLQYENEKLINENLQKELNRLCEKDKRMVLKKASILSLTDIIKMIFSRQYLVISEEIISFLIPCAKMYDLTLEECIAAAYEQIKNRKGKMVNGTFVKEEDLK